MTRTVIGLFRDNNEAQAALQDLESDGFTREHLGLVAYDGSGQYSDYLGKNSELGSNTAKGAAAGGVAGLLLGLAAVALPGIGPIVAAGPIAAALAGAGVGAATGGMLGALTDMGVPGHEAKYYEEAIRRGGTLLTVVTDEGGAERARATLDRHGALDVKATSLAWRSEGWRPETTEFEDTSEAHTGRAARVYPTELL